MKVAIIGSGAAGSKAFATLQKLNLKNLDICWLSKNNLLYSLTALPYYLDSTVSKQNILRKSNKIVCAKVEKVEPSSNRLFLSSGKTISYDKLLIATGSLPVVPKISSINLKGVFFFNSFEDCSKIKNFIKNTRASNCVIIGGGFIGIECAVALQKNGLKVTVVELLPHILSRMLDAEFATIAEKILKEHKIDVLTNEQVVEIGGSKKVKYVKTTTKKLNADFVVCAVGVKPNIDLVKDTDVKTNSGILVNSRMQSSVPNIYSAGDVAEAYDIILQKPAVHAIWPTAVEQGYAAALNIAGKDYVCDGFLPVNVIDLYGNTFVAMGNPTIALNNRKTECEKTEYEKLKFTNGKRLKTLLLQKDRIVGFQAVNSFQNIGLIYKLMRTRADVSRLKKPLLTKRLTPYHMEYFPQLYV